MRFSIRMQSFTFYIAAKISLVLSSSLVEILTTKQKKGGISLLTLFALLALSSLFAFFGKELSFFLEPLPATLNVPSGVLH